VIKLLVLSREGRPLVTTSSLRELSLIKEAGTKVPAETHAVRRMSRKFGLVTIMFSRETTSIKTVSGRTSSMSLSRGIFPFIVHEVTSHRAIEEDVPVARIS